MSPISLWRVVRYYLSHPLGRRNRWGTILRMLRWQAGSRILGTEVAIPFVDNTRLLVRNGMRGATGNVYVGLMEFEDMAFVLHFLRDGEEFIDVGANVGVYSILAASRGAQVVAIEPVPDTYQQLLDNVHLNGFDQKINARNIGVGSEEGELRFSCFEGPTNHVIAPGEVDSAAVSVPVESLDAVASGFAPVMVKIDVEGFEANVIEGARDLLGQHSLLAVLIELNGLGAKYGFSDDKIHNVLSDFGFEPMSYDPFNRKLASMKTHCDAGNTLYIRTLSSVRQRVEEASMVRVLDAMV